MHLSPALGDPNGCVSGSRALWLLCRAGPPLCALPLGHVVEVMRILPIEPIAGAPLYLRGLSIIRGTPAPIVDTAFLCCGQTAPFHRLVTVRAGTRIAALAVDTVVGIRRMETTDPLPPLLREATSGVVSMIGRLDAELLLFLSTARIVPEAMFEHFGEHEIVS